MANDENRNWKPYTTPYTGSGGVRIQSGTGGGNLGTREDWVPSSWLVGSGVAQSPSGQILSGSGLSGGTAPPNAGSVTVHSSGPPLSQESKGAVKHRSATRDNRVVEEGALHSGLSSSTAYQGGYLNPNMTLAPGTVSLEPRRPRCPTTLQREAEEARKSCSGERSSHSRR